MESAGRGLAHSLAVLKFSLGSPSPCLHCFYWFPHILFRLSLVFQSIRLPIFSVLAPAERWFSKCFLDEIYPQLYTNLRTCARVSKPLVTKFISNPV